MTGSTKRSRDILHFIHSGHSESRFKKSKIKNRRNASQNVVCKDCKQKRISLKAVSNTCLGLLESYGLREDNKRGMNS